MSLPNSSEAARGERVTTSRRTQSKDKPSHGYHPGVFEYMNGKHIGSPSVLTFSPFWLLLVTDRTASRSEMRIRRPGTYFGLVLGVAHCGLCRWCRRCRQSCTSLPARYRRLKAEKDSRLQFSILDMLSQDSQCVYAGSFIS